MIGKKLLASSGNRKSSIFFYIECANFCASDLFRGRTGGIVCRLKAIKRQFAVDLLFLSSQYRWPLRTGTKRVSAARLRLFVLHNALTASTSRLTHNTKNTKLRFCVHRLVLYRDFMRFSCCWETGKCFVDRYTNICIHITL